MDLHIILKEIEKYYDTEHDKVVIFKNPHALKKIIDLVLDNLISNDTDVIKILETVIKYSTKTNHPMFLNQLFKGTDKYGAISDLIVSLLNTSMYTYEMAPVFSLMEEEIGKHIKSIFKFNDGDIIFSPGGSLSNITAIHAARYKYQKNLSQELGWTNRSQKRALIFVSEDSHYSLIKGVSFLGLGYDSIVKIPCKNGRMIPHKLKEQIKLTTLTGKIPLMIVATAGSTVLGAFDPIYDIAMICKQYNIWLHVDASWGGTVIFSKKYRHLLKGIGNADSLTWNPHKMLRISQQCSVLLIRDRKVSENCNKLEYDDVDYLFQSSSDIGNKYLQCRRRVDILKLWLELKIKGVIKFGENVDKLYKLAEIFKNKIKKHKNFKLVLEDTDCTNVCFWYKSPKITKLIQNKMLKEGKILISCQSSKSMNLFDFFRIPFIDTELNENDLDKILNLIENISI